MRESGVIRKWYGDRGFGFAKRSHGADVFVHISQVSGFERGGSLEEGALVSFEVEQGEKGLFAVAVELT